MFHHKKERLETQMTEIRKLRDIVENKQPDLDKLQQKYSNLLYAPAVILAVSFIMNISCNSDHPLYEVFFAEKEAQYRQDHQDEEFEIDVSSTLARIDDALQKSQVRMKTLENHDKKKKLGDLTVSMVAYGFMSARPETATTLFKTAYDNGVLFFDTADLYDNGRNEEILGRAIIEMGVSRESVVIATKGGCKLTAAGFVIDNSKDYILSACEKSLARLKTPYIDLYYIHRLADDVNLDELMQTLKLLRDTGKIRHIGFSELTPDQIKTVFYKAAEYDLKIAAIENEVSLWCYDESLIKMCAEFGIGVVAYSPLGRGFFSEKAKEDFVERMDAKDFRRTLPRFNMHFRENLQIRAVLENLTRKQSWREGLTASLEHRVFRPRIASSLSELSLAWLSNLGDHVVAIPGTNSVDHLQENIWSACKPFGEVEMADVFEVLRQTKFVGDRYPPRAEEMKSLAAAQERRPTFPNDQSFLGGRVDQSAAANLSAQIVKFGFASQ